MTLAFVLGHQTSNYSVWVEAFSLQDSTTSASMKSLTRLTSRTVWKEIN